MRYSLSTALLRLTAACMDYSRQPRNPAARSRTACADHHRTRYATPQEPIGAAIVWTMALFRERYARGHCERYFSPYPLICGKKKKKRITVTVRGTHQSPLWGGPGTNSPTWAGKRVGPPTAGLCAVLAGHQRVDTWTPQTSLPHSAPRLATYGVCADS